MFDHVLKVIHTFLKSNTHFYNNNTFSKFSRGHTTWHDKLNQPHHYSKMSNYLIFMGGWLTLLLLQRGPLESSVWCNMLSHGFLEGTLHKIAFLCRSLSLTLVEVNFSDKSFLSNRIVLKQDRYTISPHL